MYSHFLRYEQPTITTTVNRYGVLLVGTLILHFPVHSNEFCH